MHCSTAGNDYSSMNGQLVFQPETGNQTECLNVSIISDEILEFDEFFSVMLVNGSVRVVLSQPVTTVIILDDDSKLRSLKLQCIFTNSSLNCCRCRGCLPRASVHCWRVRWLRKCLYQC